MPAYRPAEISLREKIDWLRLIRSENVGPVTFAQLLRHFGSASHVLEALPDLVRRGGGRQAIKIWPKGRAEDEVAAHEALGARLIAASEAEYPSLLTGLEDAPPLISVLGQAHLLRSRMVAIVGGRNASLNGRRLAEKLASDLGRQDLVVVSGLARGIDASAHTGALDTGTAAMLAGGVDVLYPKENRALYEDMKERGVLVSEQPFGTTPQARHFPRRNRLISGVAFGVVVVEAAHRSGSLITARFAAEQGRQVFAVPGSPLDPRSAGTNHLIREGATLVRSADDIIEGLAPMMGAPLREPPLLSLEKPPEPPRIDDAALDHARQAVIELLGPSPVTVDELVRQCQLSPSIVSLVLLELDLGGRLERHPGNRVSLLIPAE